MKLLIDKDFESSCLWIQGKDSAWASWDHRMADLPTEIIERLTFLSDWFETYQPGSYKPEPDWKAFEAYKIAVAIDIKRYIGQSTEIFVYVNEALGEVREFNGSYTIQLAE